MAISITEYQEALRSFPAGVTIVTSRNALGEPVGATVSAFIALSLDPPLVLVSLDLESRTGAAIVDTGAFVVHFVSEGQEALARRFATRMDGKFEGLRSGMTRSGVPTLLDLQTRLMCTLQARHSGGDHTILVGHVDEADIPQVPSPSVAWCDRQLCRVIALPKKA